MRSDSIVYTIKNCTRCNQENKKHTNNSTACRDCRKDYYKQYREIRKKNDYHLRVCYKCKEEKIHSPAGTKCVDCTTQYSLENKEKIILNTERYRRENKELIAEKYQKLKEQGVIFERQRRQKLMKIYKLSLNDYEQLLINQDSACAICGSKDPQNAGAKHLYIDHCHQTNEVRGILCSKCNSGLGFFKDSTLFLANAIDYLNNHKNKNI